MMVLWFLSAPRIHTNGQTIVIFDYRQCMTMASRLSMVVARVQDELGRADNCWVNDWEQDAKGKKNQNVASKLRQRGAAQQEFWWARRNSRRRGALQVVGYGIQPRWTGCMSAGEAWGVQSGQGIHEIWQGRKGDGRRWRGSGKKVRMR
jgi:hypothetical protein